MSFAVDPTQPLPMRWSDGIGPFRLMTTSPIKGYVMARRLGCAPFLLSVTELLDGSRTPILPKQSISVRERIAEIKARQESEVRKIAMEGCE
jgi:hypothetical protein